jgi:hypothetical protein
VTTSLLYRERDDPVKDGLANWQGLCVLNKEKETTSLLSGRIGFSTQTDPSRKKRQMQ